MVNPGGPGLGGATDDATVVGEAGVVDAVGMRRKKRKRRRSGAPEMNGSRDSISRSFNFAMDGLQFRD